MSIRFESVLNPGKFGYEFTNDSMTFWDSSYRHGGVVHCAMGYFETYGDGNVQHGPLCACRAEHFTDFLVSLVSHVLKNPDAEWKSYVLNLEQVRKETAVFLAGIVFRDDKRQWFNLAEQKVSASTAKQYDKRWFEVPTWADGTIASAVRLFNLANDDRGMREILPRYALHEAFHDALYAVVSEGDEWYKITEYKKEIPGDHHAAFNALFQIATARNAADYARRSMDCAIHNSQIKAEEKAAA